MVRPCPPTLALPSAFVSGVRWAGKIPNISLESSSQIAGTITEKAAAPGTEAYEAHHIYLGCALSGLHSQPLMSIYGCALSGLHSQPLMLACCLLAAAPL